MRKLTVRFSTLFLLYTLLFGFNGWSQTDGKITIESSQSIKQLVAQKRAYNKNKKFIKGYKIQLFYGSEQGALQVREDFMSVFPTISSELKFHSPYWKVWVGSYKTRLEADRGLLDIKEGFQSAIVVPAKVKI